MEKEQQIEIGLRVRECRENLGYSRDQFSERSGLAVSFISSIELGTGGFSADSLMKLCTALGVSADYILFGVDERTDLSTITSMLSGLEPKYLPLLKELLGTYIKTILIADQPK
jgi:transcriptional regulator with XRE-family HTH domain